MKKGMKYAIATGSVVGMALMSQAADFTALETEIGTASAAVAGIVTTAVIAAFGIFIIVWGARKIRSSLG